MPTGPCTRASGLFEEIFIFVLIRIEDLERLISFPRVAELSGRISILKSGIVPTGPCELRCYKYVYC